MRRQRRPWRPPRRERPVWQGDGRGMRCAPPQTSRGPSTRRLGTARGVRVAPHFPPPTWAAPPRPSNCCDRAPRRALGGLPASNCDTCQRTREVIRRGSKMQHRPPAPVVDEALERPRSSHLEAAQLRRVSQVHTPSFARRATLGAQIEVDVLSESAAWPVQYTEHDIDADDIEVVAAVEARPVVPHCHVCNETMRDPAIGSGCTHHFCYDCYREWLRHSSSCPLCRAPAPRLRRDTEYALATGIHSRPSCDQPSASVIAARRTQGSTGGGIFFGHDSRGAAIVVSSRRLHRLCWPPGLTLGNLDGLPGCIIVVGVAPGLGAAAAGISVGDVLLAINGVRVGDRLVATHIVENSTSSSRRWPSPRHLTLETGQLELDGGRSASERHGIGFASTQLEDSQADAQHSSSAASGGASHIREPSTPSGGVASGGSRGRTTARRGSLGSFRFAASLRRLKGALRPIGRDACLVAARIFDRSRSMRRELGRVARRCIPDADAARDWQP